jgi:hypothetical protein
MRTGLRFLRILFIEKGSTQLQSLRIDIRMGQISNQQSTLKVSSMLNRSSLREHVFMANSSDNKRGVAILISKKLNPEVLDTFHDQNQNLLLIECIVNGHRLILGSVYGPNSTCRQFYRDITSFL